MGAPVGNKNALGSHHKTASAAQHAQKAPAAQSSIDYSHLNAIDERLHREKSRLAAASNEKERAFRAQQVKAAEKELSAEHKFLGIKPLSSADNMSDDELFAALK